MANKYIFTSVSECVCVCVCGWVGYIYESISSLITCSMERSTVSGAGSACEEASRKRTTAAPPLLKKTRPKIELSDHR